MTENIQFTLKWQLKFIAMIIFTACLFIVKITIGYMMNSMTLVADSFHMVSDFAALIVGYIALRFANSKTGKGKIHLQKFTFGWIRAEVLGGLINTVFLFALCFSVFIASLKRFVLPESIINPKPVLIVGCISMSINFIGLFLFRTSRDNICQCCFQQKKKRKVHEYVNLMGKGKKMKRAGQNGNTSNRISAKRKGYKDLTWEKEYHQTPHNLNIRGVYLHILEHFLASFVVILSALISMFMSGRWIVYIDPSFTILLVILILRSTLPLFQETIILFMQSVPANIKVQDMRERLIRDIPSVLSVHEFHVWQLGGDEVVASCHILFKDTDDYKTSSNGVKAFFRDEGIACMTFQPEFLPVDVASSNDPSLYSVPNVCYYKCTNCSEYTCCGGDEQDYPHESIAESLHSSLVTSESESDAIE